MKLFISTVTLNRIQLDKQDDEGKLLKRFSATFKSSDHFKKAARELNLTQDQVTMYVDKFEKAQIPSITYNLEKYECDEFTCNIRGIAESDSVPISQPTAKQAIEAALNFETSIPSPVIYWYGMTHLAAVDLDTDEHRYTDNDLQTILLTLQPRPAYSWVTHGGGLRFIYTAMQNFAAEELASLCILTLSQTVIYDNIELKSSTRHPRYPNHKGESAGGIFVTPQSCEAPLALRILHKYTVSDEAVKDWLIERGYEEGKRYPHSLCPVAPTDTGSSDCVLIGKHGVKCYVCEAHGVKYGSHKAGFFPYSVFTATSDSSVLYRIIKQRSHFTHAEFYLRQTFGFNKSITAVLYKALLKLVHSDLSDEMVELIMTRGGNLIRLDKRWTNLWGEEYVKDLKSILSTLPACKYVSASGEVRTDEEKLGTLQQTHDLTEYGYPGLQPIWGCRIGTHHLQDEVKERYHAVIHRPLFRGRANTFSPKYISEYDYEAAWGVIERVFPSCNRKTILLFIAARGIAELEYGLPPFIFVSGPTSAGKTATIAIASAIIGDKTTSIVWSNDIERLRQGILAAKESGSFVSFDEVVKQSRAKKQSPVAAMDFLLNLTPNSTSHKLYVGATALGSLPVVAFTDNELPMEVRNDKQLSRRIVHVHLPNAVEWRSSILSHGLTNIEELRLAGDEYAKACDAILSYVIDMFFKVKCSFMDIAELLGFLPMSESEEQDDLNDQLRRLYTLTCSAPELSGSDKIRWSGKGWKLINRQERDKSDLVKTWLELCDGEEGDEFTKSRRCIEVDWQRLLDLKEPAICELKGHGISKVAIRFKNANGTKANYITNQELMK